MKKLIICTALAAVLLSALLVSCSYDKESFIEDSGTVYASPNMQEYIYKITEQIIHDESNLKYREFELNNYRIVKESITPVYMLDISEYAETGNYEIKLCDDPYYIVKVVNENDEYIGNINFRVPDDDLLVSFREKSLSNNTESFSYADHADNIRNLLNCDDIIPVDDVKVVWIDGYGPVFLIDNSEAPVWVFVDQDKFDQTIRYATCYDEENLLATAICEMNAVEEEEIAAEERWEKDYSKDLWTQGQSWQKGAWVTYPDANNIIDIYDYLGLEYEITEEIKVYDNVEAWIALACGGLVVVAVVALEIILYRKKKKAQVSSEE